MQILKRMGALAACMILVFSLCSCKNEANALYSQPKAMKKIDTGIISENDNYRFKWDDTVKCALLENKKTGYTWSTTPYDYYLTGEENYSLTSPLVIEYYDKTDGSVKISKAKECIDNNTVSSTVDKEKLLVSFYFGDVGISVTITFTLRDDSVLISFNTNDLTETATAKLLSVSVAPYFCSTPNSEGTSDYLFVPSGSGALMYTDPDTIGLGRDYSGNVYGNDYAVDILADSGNEEEIRLPVYGVKSGNNALCAIIENGDGAARIDALAGNPKNNYSTVYTTFYVRGYNNVEWDKKDAQLLNNIWPKNKEFSVGFYPLFDDDANYTGMANCYKKYLSKNEMLIKSDSKQQTYGVTLVGGAQVKRFAFGIPYTSVLPLTTSDNSIIILDDLIKSNGIIPNVVLKGYGESGIDVEKIGGGYSFSSVLGGSKGQKSIEEYCKKNEITVFTEYDIVRFTKSGNGFNRLLDTAFSSDSQTVGYYPLKRNVRVENTDSKKILFLKRSKIEQAAQKLVDSVKASGISLSSFGSMAYSDYREEKYHLKGDLLNQANSVVTKLRKNNHQVLLSEANGYVAGLVDVLNDAPLDNGGYDALDVRIPFYEMVYSGSIPMYSSALNLSSDYKNEILKCVEAGVSPTFMLIASSSMELVNSEESFYHGLLYKSRKSEISEIVSKTSEYYEKISGASIVSHSILMKDVTKTSFDNGTTVIVNYSDKSVIIDGNEIKAHSFQF